MPIKAGRYVIDVKARTHIMGIVNLTPDSFSEDGLLHPRNSKKSPLRYIERLVNDGADIIDIGAESTRPGARRVTIKEEISRLIPTLKEVIPRINIPVSVDSYKTEVIHAALDCGVSIVNIVQGLTLSKTLLSIVRNYDVPIVIMHMKGTPKSMLRLARYADLIPEIKKALQTSIDFCLDFGLKADKIIIDPGLGFAKNHEQNLEIIRVLSSFKAFKLPILIGPSRKSFLGHAIGDLNRDRLAASASAVAACAFNGADIIRVHDVAFMKDVVKIADQLKKC